ncbi:MAG: hypothetical protein CVV27_00460 [Candidatus Melainabacteria bacterium HGW-Melainabacteria-1]|nr:MAG: hypothetical protein CVV27_00460 [Candidatus Melainabacteria bacterium HGW-Melainabacteria-1]
MLAGWAKIRQTEQMNTRLLILVLLCLAWANPVKSEQLTEPETDLLAEPEVAPIRQSRPWAASFGGLFPKLPGIGLFYNLNPEISFGLHVTHLPLGGTHIATFAGRYYLQREPGSLYFEFGPMALFSYAQLKEDEFRPANFLGLNFLLGWEYRDPKGFLFNVGIGNMFRHVGGYSFAGIASFDISVGSAF